MVEKHHEGIFACCDNQVSLGYSEGADLRAWNPIRLAYGCRDNEYVKLKMIQDNSSLGVLLPLGAC